MVILNRIHCTTEKDTWYSSGKHGHFGEEVMPFRLRYLSETRRVNISTLIFNKHAINVDKLKHKFLSTHSLNRGKNLFPAGKSNIKGWKRKIKTNNFSRCREFCFNFSQLLLREYMYCEQPSS